MAKDPHAPKRARAHGRCSRCRMREVLCVCALIPRLELPTRITVLMHYLEDRKTSNTGRLATLALPNSELHVRGEPGERRLAPEDFLLPGYRTAVLFPSPEASPLSRAPDGPPLHLILPDGNWRQARKLINREPGLSPVEFVKLPVDHASAYQLRHSPHPGKLSTFEAIARALGVLEGAAVESELLQLFEVMVERVLWSRGKLKRHEVTTGIPEAALEQPRRDGRRGSA